MKSIIKQTQVGRVITNQKRYDDMIMLELEVKNKINHVYIDVTRDLECENYEGLLDSLREMKGYVDVLTELNYDMDNCKAQINKDRKYLGLFEMKAGA